MLTIKIEARAQKFLRRVPHKHGRQIVGKIDALATNPFPPDSKRLKGLPFHQVDSGEYRIAYNLESPIVHVYLIGKRNDDEVYKQLKRMG